MELATSRTAQRAYLLLLSDLDLLLGQLLLQLLDTLLELGADAVRVVEADLQAVHVILELLLLAERLGLALRLGVHARLHRLHGASVVASRRLELLLLLLHASLDLLSHVGQLQRCEVGPRLLALKVRLQVLEGNLNANNHNVVQKRIVFFEARESFL